MKLNSITQKQLIDIKNQLNKKYDKISLNNKKELVNCYSDIITVDNILNSYYIPPTFNEELTFFDYLITLIDKITEAEETLNNYKDYFKVLNNYYFNPGFYELYYKYQNQDYSNKDYIDMVKEFFKDGYEKHNYDKTRLITKAALILKNELLIRTLNKNGKYLFDDKICQAYNKKYRLEFS